MVFRWLIVVYSNNHGLTAEATSHRRTKLESSPDEVDFVRNPQAHYRGACFAHFRASEVLKPKHPFFTWIIYHFLV